MPEFILDPTGSYLSANTTGASVVVGPSDGLADEDVTTGVQLFGEDHGRAVMPTLAEVGVDYGTITGLHISFTVRASIDSSTPGPSAPLCVVALRTPSLGLSSAGGVSLVGGAANGDFTAYAAPSYFEDWLPWLEQDFEIEMFCQGLDRSGLGLPPSTHPDNQYLFYSKVALYLTAQAAGPDTPAFTITGRTKDRTRVFF